MESQPRRCLSAKNQDVLSQWFPQWLVTLTCVFFLKSKTTFIFLGLILVGIDWSVKQVWVQPHKPSHNKVESYQYNSPNLKFEIKTGGATWHQESWLWWTPVGQGHCHMKTLEENIASTCVKSALASYNWLMSRLKQHTLNKSKSTCFMQCSLPTAWSNMSRAKIGASAPLPQNQR